MSTVTYILILWGAVFLESIHCRIPTFTYVSACDDVQNVYADGDHVGKERSWRTDLRVKIPTMTKVLAVSCRNKGGPSGILGSTPGGRILTNSTWKCSSKYYPNWTRPEFKDTKWKAAVVVDNNVKPIHHGWVARKNISSRAVWISSQAKDVRKKVVVYCRLKLVFNFRMICDDFSSLYADGVHIGDQSGYTALSNVMEIPKMATYFAINCSNNGFFSGLMGANPDGTLFTDTQWKVYQRVRTKSNLNAGVEPEGWMLPEFNDTNWKKAIIVLDNITPRTISWQPKIHTEISSKAVWIGATPQTNPSKNDRSVLYFRRNLDCLWGDSCQDNGIH